MLRSLLVAGLGAYLTGRHFPLPVIGSILTSILSFAAELLFYVLYKVQIYPYYLSPLKNVPSPPGASFWFGHGKLELGTATGVIHDLWGKSVENPHPHFYRYLGFGGEEKLIITSAKAGRQVMNNEAFEMPFWFREGSKPLLGDGLVSAEGAAHKILRKAVAPAFSAAQVRSFVPAFWDVCLDMNHRIEAAIVSSGSKKTELNMLDWSNRATFDMIGTTAYGADFGGLEDPTTGFYDLFNRNYPVEGFTEPFESFCIYVLPIFVPHRILDKLPIPAFQAQQRDRRAMESEYKRLIRNVDRSQFEKEKDDAIQKSERVRFWIDTDAKDTADLITVMLKGGEIDIDTMVENMMTFTGAGYGTNASALLWALYALVSHPEMQTRLRNEIRHVLKSSKEICTYQLMDAMTYLHWFVMENSRFYPSIPGNWREAVAATSICGQSIAKGQQIITPAFAINRSKVAWGEDAEEFIPERWAPERLRKGVEHDDSLMTYSVGHKSCIGKEYSLRAIKVVLIALIGTFEFEYHGPDPLKILVPGLTLRPRGGLHRMVKKGTDW